MRTIKTFNIPKPTGNIKAVRIVKHHHFAEYLVEGIGCESVYYTNDKQDAFDIAELIVLTNS